MTRVLMVSTCGTSLLINNASNELRTLLARTANHARPRLTGDELASIDARISEQTANLQALDLTEVRRMSAELNGIIAYYDNQLDRGRQDQHLLLHTDTYQGERTAEVVTEWLRTHGLPASAQRIADLNTSDLDAFRAGMNELVSWSEQTLPGYRGSGFRVVFNLVAGFKTLQGFMQTLGMFYADEMLYIFEGSDQLLRIPRLPVQFEEAAVKCIRDNLHTFRLLDPKHATLKADDCRQIPETFLFKMDDELELSPWGRLVWGRHRREFYRDDVLDPICELLKISSRARQQAAVLQPDRREQFNQRMDDLSRYLDSNRKVALNRLDFKQLKGNPCPPSTHECDLWSDQDAWRAFGHFNGDQFIVDSIAPGLH